MKQKVKVKFQTLKVTIFDLVKLENSKLKLCKMTDTNATPDEDI